MHCRLPPSFSTRAPPLPGELLQEVGCLANQLLPAWQLRRCHATPLLPAPAVWQLFRWSSATVVARSLTTTWQVLVPILLAVSSAVGRLVLPKPARWVSAEPEVAGAAWEGASGRVAPVAALGGSPMPEGAQGDREPSWALLPVAPLHVVHRQGALAQTECGRGLGLP